MQTPYVDDKLNDRKGAPRGDSPSVSTSSNKSKIGIVDFTKNKRSSAGSLSRQLDDAFQRRFSNNSNNKYQQGSDPAPQELEVEDLDAEEDADV